MRDPSIHIKESDLRKCFSEIFLPESGVDINGLTKRIVESAKQYSCTNRSIHHKETDKITRVAQSNLGDAEFMAKTIIIVRKSLRHHGISPVKPGTRDWLIIKDITAKANEFCTEFDLSRDKGYMKYLTLAMSRLNKFVLPRLTQMYTVVCDIYSAEVELSEDRFREDTRTAYEYYTTKVAQSTGISLNLKDFPEKMVFFKRAAEQADTIGVTARLYIEAQFAMLDKMGTYPEPPQLVGEKATIRVSKYIKDKKLY